MRFALLILAGVLLFANPAGAARQKVGRAAWTLMVYMDADNSLETPELANIEEMLKVGSSEAVQIVMLCDRSPKDEPKDQYSDAAIGAAPRCTTANRAG